MKRFRVLTLLTLMLAHLLVAGCSGKPVRDTADSSVAVRHEASSLQRLQNGLSRRHPGMSGIHLLGSGTDALDARLSLIDHAQQSLDIQYYLVREDISARIVLSHLLRAARRGVHIRLLLDDTHPHTDNRELQALDRHPNISIRVFNPFSRKMFRLPEFILRFSTLTRRMHNKVLIADRAFAVTGSRNIGDEYFEAKPTLVFGDLDILMTGAVIPEINSLFDRFWHYKASRPFRELRMWDGPTDARALDNYRRGYGDSLESLRNGKMRLRWQKVELIADEPEKIESRPVFGQFLDATDLKPNTRNLEQALLIITPYFVPGEEGVRYFEKLRQRGIEVTVFTNSFRSTDVQVVHSKYQKYRTRLLAMGVEIYELKQLQRRLRIMEKLRKYRGKRAGSRASLHAKVIVYDRKRLYIGSMNADPRSIHQNTEMGLLVESPGYADAIVDWFLENRAEISYRLSLAPGENGSRIVWQDASSGKTIEAEPAMNGLQKFWIGLLSVLPGESQL